MNAPRAILPRSISIVLALRSLPGEAPLRGWVDISITLSLKMAPGPCGPRCEKIAHTHQVVAGERQERGKLDLPAASHLRSPKKSDVLRPTEGRLDELACLDAQGVSGMAGRAGIDSRATASLDVLRDVRGDVQLAGLPDELARVIALIRSEGATLRAGQLTEHVDRGAALGSAARLRHLRGDNQAMAVLAHDITEVGELGGRPGTLPIQLCLRVGRGSMRVVRALLAAKVARVIAPTDIASCFESAPRIVEPLSCAR